MKLSKIVIRNFRTLEDVSISFDGYFTSISGRNNAGKTTVIKSIRKLLRDNGREFQYFDEDEEFSYGNSKTQWVKDSPDIEFLYDLDIDFKTDPGLFSFVAKIAELEGLREGFVLSVHFKLGENNEKKIEILVDGVKLEEYATHEIYQRITSSNLAFLHNSADGQQRLFFPVGSRSFHQMMLSTDEKDELKKEQERIKKKVRKFAQEHRGELSTLLGKLEDQYEVELTIFDRLFNNSIPVGINLKDKHLEIPLEDWGSGTQNRTHIMMSILSASRIRQQENDENRVTPIIIIEEPESFLHPSAQAEFGRVIRNVARELEIQIIITTHSPYMLCQEKPESNILLDRKVFRERLKGTQVVPVNEEQWMEPYSQILGLGDEAIKPWREVVGASTDDAILVEGKIDKEYLEHINSLGIAQFQLPKGVEIVAYGGKDALKNAIMLKFVLEKFDRVFITYDFDAKRELDKIMSQLVLKADEDFVAIGVDEDGRSCIEGLLPQRLHALVYSENPNLVQKMTSTNNSKRKSAKNELKAKLLQKMKDSDDITASDLKGFKALFAIIRKAFK